MVSIASHHLPFRCLYHFFSVTMIYKKQLSLQQESMPSSSKRTRSSTAKRSNGNKIQSNASSSVSLIQYPGHVGRGFGNGLYSVGKGFYDGLGKFVGGLKTGGSTVKGSVIQGTRNLKNRRVIRAPLRMVEGAGMGLTNVASGTFSGLKTTADGFVEGGRSVVRGVTASPHARSKIETPRKATKSSPMRATSKRKIYSPRRTKK